MLRVALITVVLGLVSGDGHALVPELGPAQDGERWEQAVGRPDLARAAAEALLADLVGRHRVTEGRVRFNFDARLQAGWLGSRFSGSVDKEGSQARILLRDAPWFVPEQLTSQLAESDQLLADFDLRYEGVEPHRASEPDWWIRFAGVRRPDVPPGGAESGQVWVSTRLREVVRLLLEYRWGRVDISLRYGWVDGRLLVVGQQATLRPPGITLSMAFRDFRFDP